MASRVIVSMMRHEKTAGNLRRAYVGKTDEPIVAIDREPISHKPHTVYGSTRQRCIETAALYFPNAKYRAREGLCELDFGAYEMKTYEDLQEDPQYRAWIDNPYMVTPPQGEAFSHFEARVHSAFDDIITQAQPYIFVVHGGVIRAMQVKSGVATHFQQATATHQMVYQFEWERLEHWQEGRPCISYSEVPITAKLPTHFYK